MKLIYCPECHDVVKFGYPRRRYCKCRASWGKYVDDINAVIGGQCIPIGIANGSMADALKRNSPQPFNQFVAFTIPMPCPTIKREEKRGKEKAAQKKK